jgi:hypothetical protein
VDRVREQVLPAARQSAGSTVQGSSDEHAALIAPWPTPRAYFFAAGFAFSCFGFMLFLSFFRELLPLPID